MSKPPFYYLEVSNTVKVVPKISYFE